MGQPTGDSVLNPTSNTGSGNAQPTTPQGGASPAGPTTENSSAGTSNTPAGNDANKTFTQAELDRIIDDRLKRERAKFADYDTLKQRADQWETFVDASKTDQQKALDEAAKTAEETAYAKARTEFGSRLVTAHLQAAAAARLSEGALSALLAGVDASRFLTNEGDVDQQKVTQFIDGIAPTTPSSPTRTVPGGFGQGQREGVPRAGVAAGRDEFARRHQNNQAPPLFS